MQLTRERVEIKPKSRVRRFAEVEFPRRQPRPFHSLMRLTLCCTRPDLPPFLLEPAPGSGHKERGTCAYISTAVVGLPAATVVHTDSRAPIIKSESNQTQSQI